MTRYALRLSGFAGFLWIVLLVYSVNWLFTPEIVGVSRLEVLFRPKGDLPFNSTAWKESKGSGERFRMVDDVMRTRLLDGCSVKEIEQLLGVPDIAAQRPNGELEFHYSLASQQDCPSRSIFFPGRLDNVELWILLLRFKGGCLYSARVVPA